MPPISDAIRLQEYAPAVFLSIPTRSGIKKAIKRKEILIDGEIAKTSDWIRENQKIELVQYRVEKKIFKHVLQVVWEDDYLAVIDKSAGYPTSGNFFKTIENALPYNLEVSHEADALPYPLPVHRLDSLTSGLLLVAKTRGVQTALHQAFEKKLIEKTYLALVHGTTPATATFTDDIEGKPALSEIKTLQHHYLHKEDLSLVEINPKTGRTHQIRLHLSKNGFPIVGDPQYGPGSSPFLQKGMHLAALSLAFGHPITGSSICVTISPPSRFLV